MMFISRKVLYPWLISLFSLVLPLIILLIIMIHLSQLSLTPIRRTLPFAGSPFS
jgi:hypothetical protein